MTRATILRLAPTPAEFAPFGVLIRRPDLFGQRRMFSEWLGGDTDLAPVFHVNAMAPTSMPARIDKLERHPHAAQCFVPLDVARYVVTVAPSLADGSPDLDGLRSHVLPADTGVIYAHGVWHAGASVLDRPGSFAVLMWRGRPDDDQFLDIEPITLLARQEQQADQEELRQ